jgi:hypothetical protein
LLGSDGVFANGLTEMLPHIEQDQLYQRYDTDKPWYMQDAAVASAIIPVLVCPSVSERVNPTNDKFFSFAAQSIGSPIGANLGVTDYVFSKGASDGFCRSPFSMPDSELGMFDYNLVVQGRIVKDGLSNTLAMGEGAGGPLCKSSECVAPDLPPFNPQYASEPYSARQYWIGSGNARTIQRKTGWSSAGHFACTVAQLNKRPVTQFLFDDKAAAHCEGTLSDATSTHRVPNFRSDHVGGGNFAMGDASVRFIQEDVDMEFYRALSTIHGEDSAR